MKKPLRNLNEVLTYILEGMYDAEKRIQKSVPDWLHMATTSSLKEQLRKYSSSSKDKRLKLKRIFGYLLAGPFDRKNYVLKELIKEISRISSSTRSKRLKDVLFVSAFKTMTHLKESEYTSARDIALQLDLQTVVNMLDEILEWERETRNSVTKLALTKINQGANGMEAIQ